MGISVGSASTDKSIVRIVGYKYKKAKVASGELDAFMDKAWPTMAAEGMSVWTFFKDDTKIEAVIGMLAPSQEKLDEYMANTREKLMAEMKDILDGGPKFEDKLPIMK